MNKFAHGYTINYVYKNVYIPKKINNVYYIRYNNTTYAIHPEDREEEFFSTTI